VSVSMVKTGGHWRFSTRSHRLFISREDDLPLFAIPSPVNVLIEKHFAVAR